MQTYSFYCAQSGCKGKYFSIFSLIIPFHITFLFVSIFHNLICIPSFWFTVSLQTSYAKWWFKYHTLLGSRLLTFIKQYKMDWRAIHSGRKSGSIWSPHSFPGWPWTVGWPCRGWIDRPWCIRGPRHHGKLHFFHNLVLSKILPMFLSRN